MTEVDQLKERLDCAERHIQTLHEEVADIRGNIGIVRVSEPTKDKREARAALDYIIDTVSGGANGQLSKSFATLSAYLACLCVFACFAATSAQAASVRTPNFVVEAASHELAQEVGEAAERSRRELAQLWFGREFPTWSRPCPIVVQASQELGAGGETAFEFDRGEVFNWRMRVQGPPAAIVRDVIPHEVNHTLFASAFRQPLPRWVDEGACTTVESPAFRQRMDQHLQGFLRSQRGIAFNVMMPAKAYPRDIMPLYAQGHSVATFLIDHGGHRRLAQCIGDSLAQGWPAAVSAHYGYRDLGELQTNWLAWVKEGSPSSGMTAQVAYQGACAGSCSGGMSFEQGAGWRPALSGPVRPAHSRPSTFHEDEITPTPNPQPSRPGPQQPPAVAVKGEKGEPGQAGKDGRDGKDADPVDVDALAAAIEERLSEKLEAKLRAHPIRFDLVKPGPDGKPVKLRQSTTLGGDPIELHLNPKTIK